MKILMMTFAVLLLAVSLPVSPAQATEQPATHDAQATSLTPIHTRAELDRYLKITPFDQSPLSKLPEGARRRFLGALVWGEKGVGTFNFSDLQQYLTHAQIRRVLSLFDLESFAAAIHGRTKPLTAVGRNARETPLERKFDKLYFSRLNEMSGGKHQTKVPTLYDHLLASYQNHSNLAELDDSDVGLLFRAASDAAFASQATRYLDDLRMDLDVLHQRGLATAAQVSAVHDSLVAARRFSDANALATQYPAAGIAPLPPLKHASNLHDGNPTVLVMEPDGKSMLRKPIDMQAPLRIVVVAGCHYSVDAVRAIRADPRLDKLFHEDAVWLAPESESLPAVLDWNRQYADQPMNVAWRNSEWHMLDSWLIPTFHVFRHGKLVDQWTGWPADTGMQTLLAHLRKDGLLD